MEPTGFFLCRPAIDGGFTLKMYPGCTHPSAPRPAGADGAATSSGRDPGRPCFPCLFPTRPPGGAGPHPRPLTPGFTTRSRRRGAETDVPTPAYLLILHPPHDAPATLRSLLFPEHDRHTASSEVVFFFFFWGGGCGISSFFKKSRLNSHHIKLTILGCRIQWHLVHSQMLFFKQ